MRGLQGKKVLVTGASSGIGRACALRLRQEGAKLGLVGRNEEALRAVDPEAELFIADLASAESIPPLVKAIEARLTSVDGFVLAAGSHGLRPFMMETPARLAKLFELNVQGSLGLLASALKARLLAPGGAVVLFSSVAAHTGGLGQVAYASTKGAIEAAVRALSLEVAAQGIRINAVAPGVVLTPMSEKYFAQLTEEQLANIKRRHPLGLGKPEDIAPPVAFLLSDEARWITGAVLTVDGGLSVG